MNKELLEKIYDRLVNGYIENKDYQYLTGYDDIDKFFNAKDKGCLITIVGHPPVRDILFENIIYNFLKKDISIYCYLQNTYEYKEDFLQKLLLMCSELNPYKLRDYLKNNVNIQDNLNKGMKILSCKDVTILTGYNSIQNFEDFKKYIIENNVENLFIEDISDFYVNKIDSKLYINILSDLLKDELLDEEIKDEITIKRNYLIDFPELYVDKEYIEEFYMEKIPFRAHSTIKELKWENISKKYILTELKNIVEKYKINIFVETIANIPSYYVKDIDNVFVEFSDLLLVTISSLYENISSDCNNVMAFKNRGETSQSINLGYFDEKQGRITGVHPDF